MEFKKEELIAGGKKDLKAQREEFVKNYARTKGWNAEDLTNEQLKEIKSLPGYKNPNMILS